MLLLAVAIAAATVDAVAVTARTLSAACWAAELVAVLLRLGPVGARAGSEAALCGRVAIGTACVCSRVQPEGVVDDGRPGAALQCCCKHVHRDEAPHEKCSALVSVGTPSTSRRTSQDVLCAGAELLVCIICRAGTAVPACWALRSCESQAGFACLYVAAAVSGLRLCRFQRLRFNSARRTLSPCSVRKPGTRRSHTMPTV
jgi:hypothetical protein